MLQSTKTKSIMGIIVVALTILGFFGIKIFDITIINVGKESETQTAESQLSFSDVGNETETGIKQLSPINEANKEPETQSPPQQTDADETKTLEFSRLIGILEDLTSSSAKLDFIRDNMDLMPDSLSLVELHQILDEFPSAVDKFAVIQIFLSRLPNSLSLVELNQMLDEFPSTVDKFAVIQIFLSRLPNSLSLVELNQMLDEFPSTVDNLKVTRIFLSRLKDNYSESDFERFKQHYPRTSDKKKAIELLLRKNQKR